MPRVEAVYRDDIAARVFNGGQQRLVVVKTQVIAQPEDNALVEIGHGDTIGYRDQSQLRVLAKCSRSWATEESWAACHVACR